MYFSHYWAKKMLPPSRNALAPNDHASAKQLIAKWLWALELEPFLTFEIIRVSCGHQHEPQEIIQNWDKDKSEETLLSREKRLCLG